MILLIDNYDSFSYNLYQLIGSIDPDIRVVRNDAMTTEEIAALSPKAIILSPGPGSLFCGTPKFFAFIICGSGTMYPKSFLKTFNIVARVLPPL